VELTPAGSEIVRFAKKLSETLPKICFARAALRFGALDVN